MLHDGKRTRWNGPRNARLGQLVALNWSAEQIAKDLGSTPEAVRRHAARVGLVFGKPIETIPLSVSTAFDEEGRRYAMRGNDLIYKALRILAAQPDLLHIVCQKGGLRDTLCRSAT